MFNQRLTPKHLIASGLLATLLVGCSQPADNTTTKTADTTVDGKPTKSLAITAIVEHPALDAVRKGALDELAEDGYVQGENLSVNFQTAQGNTATAGQIAQQFVGDNPDAILAIATPSAQSIVGASQASQIPVVFSAVTDPVEAKLVSSLEPSGTNVTGLSDNLPLEPQIELIKEIIPNVKAIGYVYSPGEVNSTVVLEQLEQQLTPMGIKVVGAPAQKSVDISTAARSLQGKVDVIYTSLDNNVVSAYESLYQVAKEIKVPLIASDTDSVTRGAVAALGVNYYDLGRKTGGVVSNILDGTNPGDIAIATVTDELNLHLNPVHAQEQGIELPASVLDRADEVVDVSASAKN